MANPPKKGHRRLPLWRPHFTLTRAVFGSGIFVVTTLALTAILLTRNLLYREKVTNAPALLFVELETRANHWVDFLQSYTKAAGEAERRPAGVFAVSLSGFRRVSGAFPELLTPKDFNLDGPELPQAWNVLQLNGQDYLARIDSIQRQLVLWKVDLSPWFGDIAQRFAGTDFYAVTTEGRLVFSNSSSIYASNFRERPLVQRSIANPLTQGEAEIDGKKGRVFGFFYQLPHTNVLVFAETPRSVLITEARRVAHPFTLLMVLLIVGAAVTIWFPLSQHTHRIRVLTKEAREMAQGRFDVGKHKNVATGELHALVESFHEIGNRLAQKEDEIARLTAKRSEAA